MSDCKFAVGDRVSDMGRKGTVSSIDTFIHVEFDDGLFNFFLLVGRREEQHTRPSLKKLRKKKARYYCVEKPEGFTGFTLRDERGLLPDGLTMVGRWLKDCGTKKPKGV